PYPRFEPVASLCLAGRGRPSGPLCADLPETLAHGLTRPGKSCRSSPPVKAQQRILRPWFRGSPLRNLIDAVERIDPLSISGRVAAVNGLLVEARGGLARLAVGARAEIDRLGRSPVAAEVVGFRDTRALMMPFGAVEGIAPGAEIRIRPEGVSVRPTLAWRGRIVDAFGEPIDGKGPLPQGPAAYPLRASPPPAHARARVGERLD